MLIRTRLFVCILFWLLNLKVDAQTSLNTNKHYLAISFFGENITNPGFSFAYSNRLKSWKKQRVTKRGKEKNKVFILSWSNRYAHYYHKRNHSGNLLTTGADFERINKKGGFFQFGLCLGGNLKVFNEDVYKVNGLNEVQKVNAANNLVFTYGIKTSIGKYINYQKSNHPTALFLGSNILFSTPFSNNTVLQNAIEIGVKYHF